MSLSDRPVVIIGTLIAAICSALAAGAALFWNIGYSMRGDRIESLTTQLETYQLAEEWQASDLLPALKQASEELTTNLQVLGEVERLRAENARRSDELSQAVERIKTLEADLSAQQAEAGRLQGELNRLVLRSETFMLEKGRSKALGAYDLTVGLVDVQSRMISVRFNNETTSMEAGAILQAKVNGQTCQLILSGFDYIRNTAEFSFVVRGDDAPPEPGANP